MFASFCIRNQMSVLKLDDIRSKASGIRSYPQSQSFDRPVSYILAVQHTCSVLKYVFYKSFIFSLHQGASTYHEFDAIPGYLAALAFGQYPS
ncbi:hypothetical protein NPIL_699301 [Nephila pilipes]|uniref:Uncharacterized protein n=1 Tax=Nephila pilipes TaxID=299642 RepID=A0A8X6PQA5_NEPPI|nr:hypothetical protein NPIL_699301 [Nephila pilipes]